MYNFAVDMEMNVIQKQTGPPTLRKQMKKNASFKLFAVTLLIAAITALLPSCSAGRKTMNIDLNHNWRFRQGDGSTWLPAKVPGCVHTDLLANKKIEDPFYRTNEKDLQWIDKKEWEYKTTFNVDKKLLNREQTELIFQGLDTYADVYLNGKEVLSAANMFRQWRVPCKGLLKPGENELKVRFYSPITIGLEKLEENGVALPAGNDNSQMGGIGDKKVSVFTRKAPYHYGWDWGPRFVTSGIWKPVALEAWDKIKIRHCHVYKKNGNNEKNLETNGVTLTAHLEIESTAARDTDISIAVDGEGKIKKKFRLNKGLNNVRLDFDVANPRLWWPNGLGEQYLYRLKAAVKTAGVSDEVSLNYGIRTLRLVQEADDKGKSFYFEVNGRPVFAKGANVIPADLFLDRVSPQTYETLIQSAVKANMNMLRVWGGGIYEKDIFYDLCDKYGIMVWQDFMFACSLYPGDPEFVENVKHEAADNIKRLRNHPSVVLWCGNNEIHIAWHNWGYKKNYEKQDPMLAKKIRGDYDRIFHETLYEAVKKYHPDAPYWPSSPMAAWDPETGGEEVAGYDKPAGDSHYWGVWHEAKPFSHYLERIPRFMSEYGFQSFPGLETVKTYTLPEDHDIESEVMRAHQRHPRGNQLIRQYMGDNYHIPEQFAHFLYVSQLLQAEGIKTGIEAHRRSMPYCMGSLYWQLNDCWPVASWSGMDYTLRWKALHYAVKEAFVPVLVSPVEENGNLEVYIVSDRKDSFDGRLHLGLKDFSGQLLWEKALAVRVEGNTSRKCFTVGTAALLKGKDKKKLFLETRVTEGMEGGVGEPLSRSLYYFVPAKNLALQRPDIHARVSRGDDGYKIELTTATLAKNVFLEHKSPGEFSNNFFDLLPGEVKVVNYRTALNLEAGKLEKELKITSLRETY